MKKNFLIIGIVFIIAFNISLFNEYRNVLTSLIALAISVPWLYLMIKRVIADSPRPSKEVAPKESAPSTFNEIMFKDKIDLILIILILLVFSLSYFFRQYEFHLLIVCAVLAVLKLVRDKALKK